MQNPNRHPVGNLACARAARLLPWYVNGSLGRVESAELREHLTDCADCRSELRSCVDLQDLIVDAHIPSLALAEYAEGRFTESMAPQAIEEHLAICPSCREDLSLCRGESSLAPASLGGGTTARPWLSGSRLRRAGVAAALVLAALALSSDWNRQRDVESYPVVEATDGTIFSDGFESTDLRWTTVVDGNQAGSV